MADVVLMGAYLKHLLAANGVPDAVVEWMQANKCGTVKQFFNFVDEAKKVSEHILAQLEEPLDKDRGVVAALKQSWWRLKQLPRKVYNGPLMALRTKTWKSPSPTSFKRSWK